MWTYEVICKEHLKKYFFLWKTFFFMKNSFKSTNKILKLKCIYYNLNSHNNNKFKQDCKNSQSVV